MNTFEGVVLPLGQLSFRFTLSVAFMNVKLRGTLGFDGGLMVVSVEVTVVVGPSGLREV